MSARWPGGIVAGMVVAAVWLRAGPLPTGLLESSETESTVIVDRSGGILYEARGNDGARSARLSADRLPSALVNATLAAEDHRFWRHPGVDPIAVARAVVHDIRRRGAAEGGSTITQQVAKLLLARRDGATSSRGLIAKLREAVVALRLEHRLEKRQILVLYLNLASYGNQLVGAERASEAYFGSGAGLLTPAQAAFLASLPQRPSTFNPYRDAARGLARQRRVIGQMQALGYLSVDTAREARVERLAFRREPGVFLAPHFVQRVIAAAGVDRPRRITTTLDAALQRDVEGIIRAQRGALDRHGAHNVAAVVLDNATGEWLAWEGSGDYGDAAHGGAIDGVVAPRQPGSTLKPFTYALAFEEGDTPATVLPDVPSYFATAQDGVLFSPRNYDGRFRGPLLARRALAGSENVPAVALASRIGVPNLLRFLRQTGFTTFGKTAAYYGVGITLGDAEVRLDELVAAYSAFARGGIYLTPTWRRLVQSSVAGETRSSTGARVFSARTAFWISDILSDAEAREYAFGRGSSLEFPFAVAAKTGTSQAYHDNWAIGYTRAVTVGVWVGNFDRSPLVNSSGVTGAGPIFHAIMMAAERRAAGTIPQMRESPTVAPPNAVERRTICALSGMRANRWCPSQTEEWVAEESPRESCTWHLAARDAAVAWPAEYRQWAQSQGRPVRDSAPGAVSAVNPKAAAAPPLRVANPPPGAIYLIDPTLRRQFQTLPLRAVGEGSGTIAWIVDGRSIGASESDAALEWPLEAGRHVIIARDEFGHRAEAAIVVK